MAPFHWIVRYALTDCQTASEANALVGELSEFGPGDPDALLKDHANAADFRRAAAERIAAAWMAKR